MENQPYIFALDIGTRSVVGLILKKEEEKFTIIDIESIEHKERSMLDGQIHDVLSVSKVIKEIKEILEERHGRLTKVCVAAAGRALKTKRAKVSTEISGKPIINKQQIVHMELSAVQQAQKELALENKGEKNHYYCVGYSVVNYLLDQEEIGNLLDQQGDEASVEIISTFLPKVVVESLIAALDRANLEMEALTLEPIAAINVLIPPSMRRLNVALVDIGAGTSDIAITDLGTVVAYGMVPIAGDEITEAISDEYLLDFPLAETAKRGLTYGDEITITDILGFENKVPKEEVIKSISPAIEKLGNAISDEILSLNNNQAPKAVMLIGGGSLTPALPELLSRKLELPQNRVAIRGLDAIQSLEIEEHIHKGPELVTPAGIAIAASISPIQYITITVNNKTIRLFDMKEMTVGDCLLTAGIEMNKLYGKPGMGKYITLNKEDISIPGGHGSPPSITKNGEKANLDDKIKNGDKIIAEKGIDGQTPSVQVKDLIEDLNHKHIFINEIPFNISMEITKNGKKVTSDEFVEDNDRLETIYPKTIKQLFETLNHRAGLKSLEDFHVHFNRIKVTFPEFGTTLTKNGKEAKAHTTVDNGDRIEIKAGAIPTIKELLDKKNLSLYYQIPITFNEDQITLKKESMDLFRNGEELLTETSTLNLGDQIQSVNKKVEPFIFQDIFRYVNVDLPNMQTGKFILLRNGEETTFHTQLAPGDELKIYWPQKQQAE